MTWEANHIYAPAAPAAIDLFCAVDTLARAVHVVRSFPDDVWPEGVTRYPLAGPGLLVVRELHAGERRLTRWTDDEIVSWRALEGPRDLMVLTPAALVDTYISHVTAPPSAFLRFLKDASRRSGCPIAYYHRDLSEDQIEEEFAWAFGGEDAVFVRNGETTVAVHTATSRDAVAGQTVLALVLRHCQVGAPAGPERPYFPPHSPTFPWDAFRHTCPAA